MKLIISFQNWIIRHWLLLILVCASIILHREWFFSLSPIADGDWQFYFDETLRKIGSSNMSWVDIRNIASINSTPYYYPTYALYQFLSSFFGVGFALGERLLFLWPAALLPVISSYALGLELTKRRLFAFFVSLFYSFNIYLLFTHTGQVTVGVVYALAPFVFVLLHRLLNESRWRHAVGLGVVTAILGVYDFRFLYVLFLGVVLYTFFFYALKKREIFSRNYSWRMRLRVMLQFGCVIGVFLLLHCYWIIPLLFGSSGQSIVEFASTTLFVPYHTMLFGMLLFHPFWSFEGIRVFTQQVPFFSLFVLPLLFSLSLLRTTTKNRFLIASFGAIYFVFLFLLKQNNPPIVPVYQWLFDHIPGFQIFRESSKFGLLVVLSGSVIYALGIVGIVDWFSSKRRFFSLRYIFPVLVVLFFLIGTIPILSRNVRTLFVPTIVPQDEEALKNYIVDQNSFFRVLWIPRKTIYGYYSADNPAVIATEISGKEWKRYGFAEEDLLYFLRQRNSYELLRNASVKYVVVPLDIREEGLFSDVDRETIVLRLDTLSYLHRVQVNDSRFTVYEVRDPYPHVQLLNETNNEILHNVEMEMIADSSTKKELVIHHVPSSFHLLLTDRFDSGWSLTSHEIASSSHGVSQELYNGWDVVVRDDLQGGDVNIILQYEPQKLFVRSGIFSLASLAGVIIYYILLQFFTSRKRKAIQ